MKKNTIRSKQMDLWKMLAATEKTVVMYGMGNGADKILAVCEKYGVTVADFFASDGFVRGQSFHGKVVLSFSDVKEKYGAENIIVLVSFASSLPDVMAQIGAVAAECETYVPDVPVRGETLFCEEYYEENREDIEKALSLLADERSREVFSGVLEFRRTGNLDVLLQTADDRADVMREMLDLDTYRVAVDLGAYDGDTARELTELCPNIEKIVAFEPDRRNYRKLSAYAESEPRVDAINAAAWNENGVICFDDSGNRNAGLYEEGAKRRAEVKALTVDGVCDGCTVDFIKYDVEGSEREAIEGSADTIRRHRPDLLISLYHRTEDLHELILQIHALCPEYKLYVRRYPYIPAWDLNLYATVK
jgi:FkbM family methyltransferase